MSFTLRFAGPGLYRFMTVTYETPGMPEMKTVEPDYRLISSSTLSSAELFRARR